MCTQSTLLTTSKARRDEVKPRDGERMEDGYIIKFSASRAVARPDYS